MIVGVSIYYFSEWLNEREDNEQEHKDEKKDTESSLGHRYYKYTKEQLDRIYDQFLEYDGDC